MTPQVSPKIAIIGGGIVGLAVAYRILKRSPGTSVVVLEKEDEVGTHQSGRNSGVLHAGLYYAPGSAKARLAVRGIREMTEFCREHGVRHEICGKLVIATEEHEVPRLEELWKRGQANGLHGLRMLGAEEIREVEPYAAGLKAIHVPEEGIADYPAVSRKLAELIRARGGRVLTGWEYRSAKLKGSSWILRSRLGVEERADHVINCGGLFSDRICRSFGNIPPGKIVPFRGEYYYLSESGKKLVRHLIYPVPDPEFPFLGVHFTRRVTGEVEAGPNAVLAFAREGYRMSRVNLRDLCESLSYRGLWKFLRAYPSMASSEFIRALSRKLFCESLQKLVPEVREEHLTPGNAGVRAQVMLPNGQLIQDFLHQESEGQTHILNAPSPGATASLAFGGEIAERLLSF